jgi:ABC-type Zn2+ transport system substrate-binding protein/surface adhesin
MNTVLKKAGIVLAAATAGVLALSPLAFAGDYSNGDNGDHHGHHHDNGDDDDNGGDHDHEHGAACYQKNKAKDDADGLHAQGGLINVQDVTVQVPIQACNNSVIEGVLGILAHDQKNEDHHG